MERKQAENELNRMLKFWRVGNLDPDFKPKLINAIMDDRVTLNEETETIKINLVKPIKLENGDSILYFEAKEPTVKQMELLDKEDGSAKVEQTAFMISLMTNQAIGIVERLQSRDFSAVGALTGFFF